MLTYASRFNVSDEPYYVTGYPAAGGGGGLVGYDDYDYGDYNEGVGLLPPRPLTVTERVFKWFDGFKPPSLKVKNERKSNQVYRQKKIARRHFSLSFLPKLSYAGAFPVRHLPNGGVDLRITSL